MDSKTVYRQALEAVSRGDGDALGGLLAPDIVDHNPIPGQSPGVEGFREWMRFVRDAFPDLECDIEDVIAEDDRVAGRVTWRGTHLGPFGDVAPTGRRVAIQAFHVVRIAEDRIAEWWGLADLREVGD